MPSQRTRVIWRACYPSKVSACIFIKWREKMRQNTKTLQIQNLWCQDVYSSNILTRESKTLFVMRKPLTIDRMLRVLTVHMALKEPLNLQVSSVLLFSLLTASAELDWRWCKSEHSYKNLHREVRGPLRMWCVEGWPAIQKGELGSSPHDYTIKVWL